jgi:hypothetical protein
VLHDDRANPTSLPSAFTITNSPWTTLVYTLDIVHITATLGLSKFPSQRDGPRVHFVLHRLQIFIFEPLHDLILLILPVISL